mmetsp:Transcript_28564/g.91038  ORF Transcript_28564/g.91038 Transcript_28564/m.91038 type:complete len:228 (-) Transcript_28564:166-849(-)
MVNPHYVRAAVVEDVAEGVANDCGAQVADMHLLSHVGRGEVDNHALVPSRDGGRPGPEPLFEHTVDPPLHLTPGQADVYEPRPGNRGLRHQGALGEVCNDGLGHRAGTLILTPLSALHAAEERHGVVALEVPELRVLARRHCGPHARSLLREGLLDGLAKERCDALLKGLHGRSARWGRGGRGRRAGRGGAQRSAGRASEGGGAVHGGVPRGRRGSAQEAGCRGAPK